MLKEFLTVKYRYQAGYRCWIFKLRFAFSIYFVKEECQKSEENWHFNYPLILLAIFNYKSILYVFTGKHDLSELFMNIILLLKRFYMSAFIL